MDRAGYGLLIWYRILLPVQQLCMRFCAHVQLCKLTHIKDPFDCDQRDDDDHCAAHTLLYPRCSR